MLTGADLIGMSGVKGIGSQTDAFDSQLVTIGGLENPFETVTFASTGTAFEFSLVLPGAGTTSSSVPEPSTWVMMALGFVGLGYAAVRRNSKDRGARHLSLSAQSQGQIKKAAAGRPFLCTPLSRPAIRAAQPDRTGGAAGRRRPGRSGARARGGSRGPWAAVRPPARFPRHMSRPR